MILTRDEIRRRVASGDIEITPFDPRQLNPNSYDVRLGDSVVRYRSAVLDPRAKNPYDVEHLPPDGCVLNARSFVVGHVHEWIGSDSFVPIIHARPAVANLGLFVHVTANVVDIGNHCQFSLHLFAANTIRITPGMLIAQVSFWRVQGDIRLYTGKYKGARGPRASESFTRFVDAAPELPKPSE